MDINRYKVLVFDFDGVILDSVHLKGLAFGDLYKERGVNTINQMIDFHYANCGVNRFDKIKAFEKDVLNNKVTPERLSTLALRFSKLVKEKVTQADEIPGSIKFIESIHSTIPCYINSATPADELEYIMTSRGIDNFFKKVYGSENSKVENLKLIISETKVLPSEILFFGDALSDFSAASNIGVDFCGVLFSANSDFIECKKISNRINNFNDLN